MTRQRGLERMLLLLMLLPVAGYGQPSVTSPSNAILRIEFPELSPNMETMFGKDTIPNVMIADLPVNFSPSKKYPIVVFLDGGKGGLVLTTKWLRHVLGHEEYICVRLPLFKASKISSDPVGGLLILPKDFTVISRNYRVMLERLFTILPNITSKRSAIGGFSNGAHTTAVLLEGNDSFLMKHFDHFYFVEGGINRLDRKTLQQRPLRSARFLFMLGDRGSTDPFARFGPDLIRTVQEVGVDYQVVIMRGYGHEFPMDYKAVLKNWLYKQPLPEVAPGKLTSPLDSTLKK